MSSATILVADDDRAIRTVLTQALGRQGHVVRTTGNAATLWQWVKEGEGDLVITDVVMPDENGLDLIPRIKKLRPNLRILVMSAQNTLLTAVKATERGAFEYLPKPFDLRELISVVDRALSEPAGAEAAARLAGDDSEEQLPLIGRSQAMQEIYRVLARLMSTDLTVMIYGESGTGKELVARALHDYGKRRRGTFVAVNMAAIPRELIESELFGHEKGAFTGATMRSSGRFEQAAGGTLFLDEIGDMPLEAQTRLLRVLQEGEYTTVGGRTPIRADVRIIAATHRDLRQMVRQGLFREDLYYRLSVVPIRLPPLRERTEDIPELVRHFFGEAQEEGLAGKALDAEAMEALKTYHWPGNVRELENLVRRLAVLYSQETIGRDVIDSELNEGKAAERSATAPSESLGGAVEHHLRSYFAAHEDGLPASGLYEGYNKSGDYCPDFGRISNKIPECMEGTPVVNSVNAGLTFIVTPIWEENLEEVKKIIEGGFDVNTEDAKGQTALTTAVLKENTKIVEYLLSVGADPNKGNVLLYSVRMGHSDHTPELRTKRKKILKLLLNHGADPTQPNLNTDGEQFSAKEDAETYRTAWALKIFQEAGF